MSAGGWLNIPLQHGVIIGKTSFFFDTVVIFPFFDEKSKIAIYSKNTYYVYTSNFTKGISRFLLKAWSCTNFKNWHKYFDFLNTFDIKDPFFEFMTTVPFPWPLPFLPQMVRVIFVLYVITRVTDTQKAEPMNRD